VLQSKSGDWLVLATNDVENVGLERILQIRPLYWQAGWPISGRPLTAPVLPGGKPGEKKTPSMAGRWSHFIDYAPLIALEFHADGTLEGANIKARWELEGNALQLEWPDAKTPSGFRTEHLQLEPDGDGYVGRNEQGQVILGSRTGT
jgi:hypothetical protein